MAMEQLGLHRNFNNDSIIKNWKMSVSKTGAKITKVKNLNIRLPAREDDVNIGL